MADKTIKYDLMKSSKETEAIKLKCQNCGDTVWMANLTDHTESHGGTGATIVS